MVSSVYNYYLTNYGSKKVSRYDTHKRNELRNVYHAILKLNKESPLYKIDFSEDAGKYAIDIKENARVLKNIVTSLSEDSGSSLAFGFGKKVAMSSDEDTVLATYIGDSLAGVGLTEFTIEVNSLASSQVNIGNFLVHDELNLEPEHYSFDVAIGDLSYEFQFGIEKNDTNLSVQEKLGRMITKSNIGIKGTVIEDGFGHSSLKIDSTDTGLTGQRKKIFSISDDHTSKESGAIKYLGIDSINEYPHNAVFLLNGAEQTSNSNTFTVNKTFELTLKDTTTESQEVHIGFKSNIDSIIDNVHELVNGYNSMISLGNKYSASQERSSKLVSDFSSIAGSYMNQLESIGLSLQQDKSITVDEGLLVQSLKENDAKDAFEGVKKFKNDLLNKAVLMSLDPMEYLNKVIVAYKNPRNATIAPYVSSIYSGLMFNGWY